MIIFLDTKLSNFMNQKIVSIGLVAEHGKHEFYAERKDLKIKDCAPEVIVNVLPLLGKDGREMHDWELSQNLREWFEQLPEKAVVLCENLENAALFQDAVTGFGLKLPPPEQLDSIHPIDKDILLAPSFVEVKNASWGQKNRQRHHALQNAKILKNGWIHTKKLFQS